MKDIVKDWRRWTRTERFSAIVILTVVLCLPALLALNAHSPTF